MSTTYEIPLTPEAQTFKINLAGKLYQINLWWNDISKNWNFDINDQDGNAIINSIPLIPGYNLLEQFDYLNFGGSLIAKTDGNIYQNPTYDNFGETSHIYFIAS